MKHDVLKKWLFFFIAVVGLDACKKNTDEEPYITIKEETVSFPKESSNKVIEVNSNIQNWTVSVPQEAKSWLSAVKEGTLLKIEVTTNTATARTATLLLAGNGIQKEVKVQQIGASPSISPDKDIIKLDKFATDFELVITTNVEYDIILPDWVTQKSKQVIEGNLGYKHILSVAAYEAATPRTGAIKINSKNVTPAINKTVMVSQKGQYANDDAASVQGDIKLKIARGTASSFQTGEGIEKSFDGDMATIYHSAYNNSVPNYFPITLEYVLEQAENVDYMVYYPRTVGTNGHFKQTEIWVSTEQNTTFTKIKDFDFQGNGAVTRVTFDQTIVGAKSFKIIVKSGLGHNATGFAAAAEIEFWKKNTDSFNPLAIFTDATCSELKAGITDEQIQAIANPFYKSIAMYMKNGQYPSEFRIQEYRAWPNPNTIRQQNQMQYSYSNLDNPTGIAVDKDEELIVFVGPTQGRNIQIKIMNLDKPGGDGFDQASYHPLYEGTNKIKAGSKGLIYLQYQTADYASVPKVKVHFATGRVNGYYDKTKHTAASDWSRLLNAATEKYFDVIGENAHLCFPTLSYKTYTGAKGKELIDIYDDLVEKTHIFSGTVGTRAMVNRAYFQVMYTSYMYCTAYRTSYNETTMSTVCNPDVLRTNIWGPAHEIGHAHQVARTFMWIGMTEVTVNMNSMNIQTAWGLPTRLETESMQNEGGYNNRYEKAYNRTIVPERAFAEAGAAEAGGDADVFCNLIPFWQLNLYFSKVKNDPQFYVKMYEAIRVQNTAQGGIEDGKAQVNFTKIASTVANANLIPFFEKWGFYKPFTKEITDYVKRTIEVTETYANQVKGEINALGLPTITDKIEYISDSNWTYFRDKVAVVKGSATISGSRVTTTNYQNVVAYEVYEGSALIFVSNKNSFDFKQTPTANIKIYAVAYNGQKTEVTFD